MESNRATDASMKTLCDLEDKFNKTMKSFEERFTTASSTTSLQQLGKDFLIFKDFVRDSISLLRAQISNLTNMTEELENRSRLQFLIFRGIKETAGENTSHLICNLGSSKLRQDVKSEDIRFSYRMGKTVDPEKPPPILVKFQTTDLRAKLWSSKKLLKDTGISLAEFMTPTRRQLFVEGRRLYGINNCWSQDYRVFIKLPNGTKQCPQSIAQLQDMAANYPPSRSENLNKKVRSARFGKQVK